MQQSIINTNKVSLNKLFLLGGAVSAPFFYFIAIAQAFTRTGFDIRRHAISTLTLGELGWIQSANFIVTGLLALLTAFALRNSLRGGKGSIWGPLLIGIYGLGMTAAGFFRPDPGLSFPPGAPEGMPTAMSVGASLHSAAFFTAFLCLIAACLVFARRFANQDERGWSTYCLASAVIAPLLIGLGMGLNTWIGVIMGIAGMVAFGFVSALALRFRSYES